MDCNILFQAVANKQLRDKVQPAANQLHPSLCLCLDNVSSACNLLLAQHAWQASYHSTSVAQQLLVPMQPSALTLLICSLQLLRMHSCSTDAGTTDLFRLLTDLCRCSISGTGTGHMLSRMGPFRPESSSVASYCSACSSCRRRTKPTAWSG